MAALLCGMAMGQYIPPDRMGGEHEGSDILRLNSGQVFGTDGPAREDVAAYFEGTPLGIYLRDSSRVSFTMSVLHHDSISPDTAYRVDMAFAKAKYIGPDMVIPASGLTNYYQGKFAVEQVPAYRRGIYEGVYDQIDFHMYGSSGGPRMAFVVRPGGNPNDIRLQFTGQDSLGIDWMGSLKAYLGGKWVELKQATAYQVTNTGGIYDVPWTPSWVHDNGTVYARLNFGNYDPQLPLILQIGYGALGGGDVDNPRNLAWSTFIGGTGADELTDVQVDGMDNPYICGSTWPPEFPMDIGISSFDPFLGQALGWINAVVMKFNHANKHMIWGTYYGGGLESSASQPSWGDNRPRTDARKVAVPLYGEPGSAEDYIYTTGTTNCSDFTSWAESGSPFETADNESYASGYHRMWVGAFKKEDGTRDWATTHGLNDDAFAEEGLAIAYHPEIGLAVGGRVMRYLYTSTQPVFPCVTPAGAYQQSTGGGFVMLFNTDFTIRWSTAFAGYWNYEVVTQVTDLCFTRTQSSWKLWLTGASEGPGIQYAPMPPPQGIFMHQYGMAFLASFDVPTLQLDYCTGWGGTGTSVAYGLDYDGKALWVVGGTESMDLTDEDCPPPLNNVPGVHYTAANGGWDYPFQRCDGFILAFNPETYELDYGTLIGSDFYDMLLDVCHDQNHIYITGETRSSDVFADNDLDMDQYYQPLNPNITSRDAVVLAIRKDASTPVLEWNTAFGGTKSERGWAIAASESEVYIVGATASNLWDAFPLRDFDPTSQMDFYQNYNLEGDSWIGFLLNYAFEYGLNYIPPFYGELSAEPAVQEYDGFIASFNSLYHVGITRPAVTPATLQISTLPIPGQWAIQLPEDVAWDLSAYNAAGQLVGTWHPGNASLVIDLREQASGLYVLLARSKSGKVYSSKIVRP